MKALKRIMVGLDLTEMDEVLIRYTSFMSDVLGFEKIYFVHIEQNFEFPPELKEEFSKVNEPVDEQIHHRIEKQIEKNFDNWRDIGVEIEVLEGDPFERFMHRAHVKEIDLIIAGRKLSLKGAGILPERMVRKSTSSVMFVPENQNSEINKIVVPIDFSDHSKMALEEAAAIAQKTGASLICLHIYSIPMGYYKTGKSFEDFSEIMKGHAQKKMEGFLKKCELLGQSVKEVYSHDSQEHASKDIFTVAKEESADFILMGSKGKTDAAVVLLGSMAEKLINKDNVIPLLIMKKKNENLGFFQALMKI